MSISFYWSAATIIASAKEAGNGQPNDSEHCNYSNSLPLNSVIQWKNPHAIELCSSFCHSTWPVCLCAHMQLTPKLWVENMKFRFLELLKLYFTFNFNFCVRRPTVRPFGAAFVLRIVHLFFSSSSFCALFLLRSSEFNHIHSCVVPIPRSRHSHHHVIYSPSYDDDAFVFVGAFDAMGSSVHCFTFWMAQTNNSEILGRRTKGETKNFGHFRKYPATLQQIEKSRGWNF